jgi:UDP-3-O-[3-hydroxymyristoyl] N-acetylglucosamine deacetylase/3-hydroxyacyl-[acyl-carrier-protein] dehydratase
MRLGWGLLEHGERMITYGSVRATRPQRTLGGTSVVAGMGFFHGGDVTVRFRPGRPDSGIVFERIDLPDRPTIPARIENVIPTARRTTIRRGLASVEMIEHVMAALAGLRVDNCVVEIDGAECPGCDGSSKAFVEAIDRAGIVDQDRPRSSFVVERTLSIQDGNAQLAVHPGPQGRTTISYHLDYGRSSPIPAQSFAIDAEPELFRDKIANSRTFVLESEAQALRAAGLGVRLTPADLLIYGPQGIVGANSERYPDECARHKILDVMGDLALLGMDLHGSVVAHRSGHQTTAMLVRKLRESADAPVGAVPLVTPLRADGTLDIEGIMALLPHRYPFLLVDRVLEIVPHTRAVAIKNVSVNEPFFQGHWPGLPIMPGVLIVEALAQAAGVLIATSLERNDRVALIAAIDEVKLRKPVAPGDQLRLEVEARRIKLSSASVNGVAKVGGQVAASAKLRFIMVDPARAAQAVDGVMVDRPVRERIT